METHRPTRALGEVSTTEVEFVPGLSPAMQALERAIAEVAHSDIPVLLLGEPGTGKRTLARRIHAASARCHEPFLSIDCELLSPDSFESWLAGRTNGSANPTNSRAGALFFSDIADLSKPAQAWLLHSFFNGPALAGHAAGPQVFVSSYRNLEQEVQEEHLREDLYYRIRGVCLQVPPLRHRREDIPGLIEFFLDKYSKELQRPRPQLTVQMIHFLLEHPWPGNVRQLRQTVLDIVAQSGERPSIQAALLQRNGSSGDQVEIPPLKQAAREASRLAERQLILQVLSRTQGNRKRAAQVLKISYKALLYKLKQIGFEARGSPLE